MATKYEVYKCEECGNVVMMTAVGGGTLVCCGQEMKHMAEQTADSITEKHVPLIAASGDGYDVTVGSTLHPMLENHWIQWIELVADGKRMMAELKPGDEPKAHFCVCGTPKTVSAREYCNVHGLWRGGL
jgi:superoxide reductase